MTRMLLGALALASCLLLPAASSAGIVTDLRTTKPKPDALVTLGSPTFAAPTSSTAANTAPSVRTAQAAEAPSKTEPVGQFTYPQSELKQIAAGLITPEEAAVGCGGASAAQGGPSPGLLVLLLGALALRGPRRRLG